jgi:hypothetical protein
MRNKTIAAGIVALISLLIQLSNFPAKHDLRYGDEGGYTHGCLQLLEGMVPEYKYSPAGPQTWIGWAYGGIQSARYVLFPTSEERAVPLEVRPFVAVNHALWDNYYDMGAMRWVWVLSALPFMVWAAVSGFNLGYDRAAMLGGILVGGIVAVLPIFVDLSGQARPYAMSWALAIIALDYVLVRRKKSYLTLAAILAGLAIGSRIDMLLIMPLIWSELWSRRNENGFLRPMLRFHLIAMMTTLLVAPWLLTNLIGNLRIIATVRLSGPPFGFALFFHTLRDVFWNQGLIILLPLMLAGLFMPRSADRRPRFLLAAYAIFLTLSMFKSTGFGLQHQGGPLVVIIVLSAGFLPFIINRWPRGAWIIVAAALFLPTLQTLHDVWHRRRDYVADESVKWLEQNVPPGTRVYFSFGLTTPLPTVESSDFLWREINDDSMWQKKFQAGLSRFHLASLELPRALSDENMITERGNRRYLFILGSRSNVGTRFDLRQIGYSQIIPPIDPSSELRKTGGVALWRGNNHAEDPEERRQWNDLHEFAGEPVASWVGAYGRGAYIFVAPETKAKLKSLATQPTIDAAHD